MEGGPDFIRSIDEPGLRASGDVLRTMRQEVANLLQRNQSGFPGAQPVSFARKHIDELQQEDYYVCEKSDGIRYLLYMTEDETGKETHYLIDRKNDFWYISSSSLHFPLPNDEQAFHTRTLLDGELVIDEHPNGRREPMFLVFDCLALDGQLLTGRDLSKRLGYFQNSVNKPYRALLDKYPQERQYQPFFLSMKDMQVAYGIQMLFAQIPQLRHGNDGLIFTRIHSEYKHGTDPNILKWKEAEENTIDFRWKLNFPLFSDDEDEQGDSNNNNNGGVQYLPYDFDAIPQVELQVHQGGGSYAPYASCHLEPDEWETLKALGDPLNNRVVECYMDGRRRWRFSRFRDDKMHGNHISVVGSVVESIRDGVTKEDLLAASKAIRDNWKAREARRQ